MNRAANDRSKQKFFPRSALSLAVVVLNIVLLSAAVALYGRYVSVYQERLRDENLGNIANLNLSAASNAETLIDSWSIKLDDIVQYIGRRGADVTEALMLLEDSNSSEDRQFELIGGDYTGYLARRGEDGAFLPVSYQGNSYSELQKSLNDSEDRAFADFCFAPEFTDSHSALKYFAIYRHLPLVNAEGTTEVYTLLLATKSRDVLAVFNQQDDFNGQSTVLTEDSGNYIVSSNDFKSTNFFQYLYVYNDLSLDERIQIEREMAENGSGELYYKNAMGEDCVFCYERMKTNDWYCITCVPLSSFRVPVFNINYALYAVAALLFLLLLDVVWLQYMNRRLRVSMQHEKEAGEAKTDFLSRMSHDIRTPLNGIIGLTALAIDEPNPPRTQEYLENINLSGNFLLGLVNDILDMSKVESGKVELRPEPYACKAFCQYVEAVVQPLCNDKGLTFRVSAPQDEPPVLLDHLRFNQIFFNLLSNAVKFTPSGGLVELYWKQTPLPGERVALECIVRDNGIGMSEEFQAHMFESFSQERAQPEATGTGLGLTIAASLVQLMGGTIDVASRQGAGTTFTIRLETTVSREEMDGTAAGDQVSLIGKHILLCEDNNINIMVAQRLLEKWGVRVDTAVNGKLGVERFASAVPGTYDAILMDVIMPEMNGLDATRAIRALDRADAATVPIIAMTANAYDTDVKNCLEAGMNAHVGKPVNPEQLRLLLEEYLRGR